MQKEVLAMNKPQPNSESGMDGVPTASIYVCGHRPQTQLDRGCPPVPPEVATQPQKKEKNNAKKPEERASEMIKFRATEAQKSKLKDAVKQSKFKDISKFIWAAITKFMGSVASSVSAVFTSKYDTKLPTRVGSLTRIANNLNQIARALNTATKYDTPIDIFKVQVQLVLILNELVQVHEITEKLVEKIGEDNADEYVAILKFLDCNPDLKSEILVKIHNENGGDLK
jgi:hypothetical protein